MTPQHVDRVEAVVRRLERTPQWWVMAIFFVVFVVSVAALIVQGCRRYVREAVELAREDIRKDMKIELEKSLLQIRHEIALIKGDPKKVNPEFERLRRYYDGKDH